MREMLFRGKAIDIGWIEWRDVVDDEWHLTRMWCVDVGCKEIVNEYFTPTIYADTIGQYTGLKDKNGRKVFEGDILSGYLDDLFPEEESRYEVIWHDYGWHIKSSDGIFDTMEQNWINMFLEVIGNIHDNKNLLKNQEVGE